jgi:hypothetical protein
MKIKIGIKSNKKPMIRLSSLNITDNVKNDDVLAVKNHLKSRPEIKSFVFLRACGVGAFKTAQMLLNLYGVDPSIDNNIAVQLASELGHARIVSLLLTHPKTDPSRRDNSCIQHACKNGHADVVKILLKDCRINPFVNDCYPMEIAIKNKHYTVIKLLVSDPRIYETENFRSLYTFCKIHEDTFYNNRININNDVLFIIKTKLSELSLTFGT